MGDARLFSPFRQPRCQPFSNINRSMLSTGAADGYGQVGFAFLSKAGQKRREKRCERREKLIEIPIGRYKGRD